MNSLCATVSKILPFSCVDGPGNRLVIFLQGCNFRCPSCHNPYTIGFCNQCGECAAICPHQALSLQQGAIVWQQERCQQCDSCLQYCPHSSSPMTYRYTVAQILDKIRHYAPFLTGITLSGGEASLQLPFVTALFQAIKQCTELQHLSCFLDSNGSLSSTGWSRLLPYLDGAMIDLKAWDSQCHHQLTGQGNSRIKEGLSLLARANKLYEIRLLLIPQQSDFIESIDQLAHFLRQLSPTLRIRLNAFQLHGVRGEAKSWPPATEEQIEQLAALLIARGCHNIVRPAIYL